MKIVSTPVIEFKTKLEQNLKFEMTEIGINTSEIQNILDAYAAYPLLATRIGEWDVRAPSVILEEAGGIITDFDGRRFTFNNSNPYFSNGVVA